MAKVSRKYERVNNKRRKGDTDAGFLTGLTLRDRRRTPADSVDDGGGAGGGGVSAIAFSRRHCGIFVTVHRGGEARVWTYPQCALLRRIQPPAPPVAAAVSDSGAAVALVLGDATLRVLSLSGEVEAWADLRGGELRRGCDAPPGAAPPADDGDGPCAGVACFTTDAPGTLLAGAAGRLWSLDYHSAAESGGVIARVPLPEQLGGATALGGALPARSGRGGGAWLGVAGTAGGGVALLTGAAVLVTEERAHTGRVVDVALASDGTKVASVGADGVVIVWRYFGRGALTRARRLEGSWRGASFSSDARLLACVEERTLRVSRLRDLLRGNDELEDDVYSGRTRRTGTVHGTLAAPCGAVAFVPFVVDRQFHLLKDPDMRASIVAAEGAGAAAFEIIDFDATRVSRAIVLGATLLAIGAAFLTWLIP